MVDSSKLAELQKMLIDAKDLGPVMNFFFDEFCEHPEFLQTGTRTSDPMLETIVTTLGRKVFGAKARIDHFMLLRVPEHGFLHGVFFIDGRMGNVFYFEQIMMGMAGVVTNLLGGENHLIRFSGFAMPMEPDSSGQA